MDISIGNCDAGRRLGCGTFCCRLLVRYDEDERPPSTDGSTAKGCVDKAVDGFCIHLDRATLRCDIWEKRPRVCREYHCAHDYMLQVAVRVGVKNIVQLSRDSLSLHIPKECFVKVPGCGCGCSDEPKNGNIDHD